MTTRPPTTSELRAQLERLTARVAQLEAREQAQDAQLAEFAQLAQLARQRLGDGSGGLLTRLFGGT